MLGNNNQKSLKKRRQNWIGALFFLLFIFSIFTVAKQVYSAIAIMILTPPAPKSAELPSTIARGEADAGKNVKSARYQVYPSSEAPNGTINDCTANSGTFGVDQIVDFSCIVSNLGDGSYKMNIIVTDSDNNTTNVETDPFIVDRLAPSIDFDDLKGDPLLINDNDPVFTGTVTDSLTSVVGVQYKWMLASTTSPVPSGFADSGWTNCSFTGSGTTVDFTCDPGHAFADSVKGDEYRMHVRAIDEIGNLSGPSNYYKFQVDTTAPYNLNLLTPTEAGIVLYGNTTYSITWTTPADAFELGSGPIQIFYSEPGDFIYRYPIANNLDASGPFNWTVPSHDTTNARIWVEASDLAGNIVSSSSTNPFTIIPYTAPNVIIDSISNNITTSMPMNFTATASDVEGIVSARYRIDSGTWYSCSAADGAFDENSEGIVCSNVIASQGSRRITIEATDGRGDVGSDYYDFIYDYSNPYVNAGSLGTINIPTTPGASASDSYSGISSTSWTKVSGPGTINFSSSNVTNPYISASINGDYVARLTVYDGAGFSSSDTVSFTWTDEPLSFNIIEPSGGERLKGGDDFLITWTDPGGSADYTYNISYSSNGGTSWTPIVTDFGKGNISYNWTLPSFTSEAAVVKVDVINTSDELILTDNSSIFTVDSTPPTVEAGSIADPISEATIPGASASDNYDDAALLTYNWTHVSGPTNTTISDSNILNPSLSGTISGDYTARLTVTDSLGNSASDTITFSWDGDPPSFFVLAPETDYYRGGLTEQVLWTPSSAASYYALDYTLDNGLTFNSIVANTTGTVIGDDLYYDWALPEIDSTQVYVRVTAYDSYGNYTSALSPTFTIDSTPPSLTIAPLPDIYYLPITPTVNADDGTGSGIASYSWTQISGPGNVIFTGGTNIAQPTLETDASGTYELALTVTDNLGLSQTKSLSFHYKLEPPPALISSPGSEEIWAGAASKNIRWDISDPGDLDDFLLSYSLDDGASWIDLGALASTTRQFAWSVPELTTEMAQIRIITTDVGGLQTATTRNFIIDSQAPVITLGDIGSTSVATSSGTVITDDIDSASQIKYVWTQAAAPAGGTLVFTPAHNISDPVMAGTVTGDYRASIVATDRAGHLSSAFLNFYWDGNPGTITVTSPTSTVFIKGGETQNIDWHLIEGPNDLSHFELSYSLDNGSTWHILTTTSSSTRSYAWEIPEGMNSEALGSAKIEVKAIDVYNNVSLAYSPNFTIDSISPIINMGTLSSPLSEPTAAVGVSASDNIEAEADLSFTWSVLSLPYDNATLTIEDVTATSSRFAGNMSGDYELLLTVLDRTGNVATSSLAFTWDSLYDPLLTAPQTGDFLAGGTNTNIVWELEDPGDLIRAEVQYSIDNGLTWQEIEANIASSSREYSWLIPDTINSTSSLVRIMTVDENLIKATSTSGIFNIDSTNPVVDAGSYADNVNSPTAPGASASDNISISNLSYLWSQESAPRGGVITFTGGVNILNPRLSGNLNGNYSARLTVTDQAGNSSSDTVSFTRYIGSSGGGGGGGGSATICSEVVYGQWSACFNGTQYRSIISTTPSACTLSEVQKAAQERACSSSGNAYCQVVEYGAWGDCVAGKKYREIIKREPDSCDLTSEQQAQSVSSCTVSPVDKGPFDEDALAVMEAARKYFAGTDEEMLRRVTGQILLQVEDHGRAWYVSAKDKRRYYLGSPNNAFSVMSLIGLGITNERLSKIPVGLLDDKLILDKDSDGDGLSDRFEEGLLSNPFKTDSDGDGHDDRTELLGGYNLNGSGRAPFDANILSSGLGHIYIQVETNGEAWYVEPRSKKRYYLGRPEEAFAIMREFGLGITNEDINKIPVGQFSQPQLDRITRMLEDRKRELEARK